MGGAAIGGSGAYFYHTEPLAALLLLACVFVHLVEATRVAWEIAPCNFWGIIYPPDSTDTGGKDA
jgi:hypothetical protein